MVLCVLARSVAVFAGVTRGRLTPFFAEEILVFKEETHQEGAAHVGP